MTASAALKKVQIARKELRLDDETYRAVLERLTAQRSAADCSDDQLKVVLEEFKAKGWKPRVVAGGKPKAAPRSRQAAADHPSAKKARALWLSLWNLGEVDNPSEAALEAMARRQLKVERLQWADQAQCYKLIEALKAMAERAGWSQSLAGTDLSDPVLTLKRRLMIRQSLRLEELGVLQGLPIWMPPGRGNEKGLDNWIAAAGRMIRTELARRSAEAAG